MTGEWFEPIEDEDFLPGAHNPCALVHNPFEWNGADEAADVEQND